jgi:hypothetical protein
MLQRSNECVQDVSKRYNWCASKASMPTNPSAATVLQILCTYLMKIVDSECVPAYITSMAARCSENGLALAGRNGKRSEQPGVSSKQDSRTAATQMVTAYQPVRNGIMCRSRGEQSQG